MSATLMSFIARQLTPALDVTPTFHLPPGLFQSLDAPMLLDDAPPVSPTAVAPLVNPCSVAPSPNLQTVLSSVAGLLPLPSSAFPTANQPRDVPSSYASVSPVATASSSSSFSSAHKLTPSHTTMLPPCPLPPVGQGAILRRDLPAGWSSASSSTFFVGPLRLVRSDTPPT